MRFSCYFLPDRGNVSPLVRRNKQKERARREMHFMVLNQVKCYERFNHKKNFINVLISVQFNLWPSDHHKFILKFFKLIVFNSAFIIPQVRFFCCLYRILKYNSKISCLLITIRYLMHLHVKSSFKWRVTLSGELMFLESYGDCDVTNTVTFLL